MNRSLTNVLFGGIGTTAVQETKIEGTITKTRIEDTVDALSNADNVILVRAAFVPYQYNSFHYFDNHR